MNDDCTIRPFWETSYLKRMHPRMAAELALDARQSTHEGKAMFEHLTKHGFTADFIRTKGYLSSPYGVAVVPFYNADLTAIGGLSIRRNVNNFADVSVEMRATVVRMSSSSPVIPLDFTIIAVEGGEVTEYGPVTFDELTRSGVDAVLQKLCPTRERVARLSKGRGLAPVVLSDLVSDELKIGFLSEQEASRILSDAALYTDLARLNAYVASKQVGCSYCCSSSCYACTSCSCNFNLGSESASTS